MSAPALGRFRMLDVSRQLPGPFCSTLLADLGMDVLVVTAPHDPFGIGVPFLARNKRHMALDLKQEEGRAIFARLADDADVVLEGFRPGVMRRLGLDADALRARNPRLVYCAISGYGQDGPYRDRAGHDVNYLGQAGVLEYGGTADGPPMIPPVQVADLGGGSLMAAVGILTALLARDQTGRGQVVDVAMLDGAAAWNVARQALHWRTGAAPQRGREQLTGYWPCYRVYATSDGRHLTVGAYEPSFWAALCRHFGRDDFVDAQWSEARRDEMVAFFEAAFRTRTMAEWLAELEPLNACVGPVLRLDEAWDDPQLRHRGLVQDADTRPYIGCPITLSDTPAGVRTPPAAFGQHTDEVLGALGYTPTDIAGLRERGVVR